MYRRRNSLRLKDYDYSSEGAYFVTISCDNKKEYFKTIPFKEIAEKNLKGLNKIYALEIDHFCVMPDHIHLILFFKQKQNYTLSQLIQRFKSVTARDIREEFGVRERIWQRGFYDHVIRDEEDYLEKAQYILNNRLKKELERERNELFA
ncbi:MAG TPA: transposase [candidate division Zixibacteria bacterium]|jgi:REP element-mobilizing transposase RayT